jgi:tetratricopeptide (TPR) repeat protein
LPGTDTSRARFLAQKARQGGCSDTRAFADALLTYLILRDSRAEQRWDDLGAAPRFIPALKAILNELHAREQQTSLGLEAEARLHLVIANVFQQVAEFENAERHASHALILAETLDLPITRETAVTFMTCSLLGMGRLSESLDIMSGELRRAEALSSPSKDENERLYAETLFTLGDHYGALDILDRLQYVSPENTWAHATATLFRSLIGEDPRLDASPPEYEWSSLYNWLQDIMSLLVHYGSLPHLNPLASEREASLRRVIQLSQPGKKFRDPWNHVYELWVRSLAYLHLGETGMAGITVGNYQVKFREWLDMRLVLAAIRLELALQLRDPQIQSARKSEDELRSVFEDAKTIPSASREGLAQRLQRWHPTVAAYCSVMPDPIPELLTSSDMILRIKGPTCTAYGLQFPAVYAAELVLRSLRLGDKQFIQAPLNKGQICQREQLLGRYRNADYWRPVVSGAHLVFGLMKAGEGRPKHHIAAQRVASDFGITPQTRAAYAAGYMELVEDSIKKLLSGTMNPESFAEFLDHAPPLF